ncbi:hypothetical protein BAE44_0003276 [Dichanthelium oligosanthes]|uniref:Uncharacterized protein n=1 Tax=Dichanthelium oligosanthes TaxID=888268 RepID=A0A1E5WEC1_9POAL|nr:hypothetical protein BAE44_0003276 [Dichanthelium oligosanthes]
MADQAARGLSPSPFTALELAAAEQLIHLSESSCSSGAAASLTPCGAGGPGLLLPASAASSSTSPRSVNNAPPPPVGVAAEDDEDEQEVAGRQRRNRRYRPIAEIYAATDPKPIAPRRRKADRPRATAAAAARAAK